MRHGTVRFLLCTGLALFASGQASLAGNRSTRTGMAKRTPARPAKPARSKAPRPKVIGTLKFDNDIPFNRDGTVDAPIGNVFDVRGPYATATLTRVSFRLAGCFSTPFAQAQVSIFDVDPTAMHIQLLQQFSGGGTCVASTAGTVVRSAMLPTWIVPPPYPLIAAIRNTPFTGCAGNTALGGTCEGVALSMGVVDPGFGFHAIRVGGSQSTAPNLGDRNAIIRAGYNIFPVELMSFDVE